MTVLAADTTRDYQDGVLMSFKVAAATKIYANALVCRNSSGYAIPAADTAGLLFIGIAAEAVDNTLGAAGAVTVTLRRRGVFLTAKGSAVVGDVGQKAFILDDNTVARSNGVSNAVFAGMISGAYDGSNVWLDIDPAVIQSDVATHLGDTTDAHAASAITVTDAGSFTAQVTTEAALQEIYQHTLSAQKVIPLPLTTWREATTFNVGNIAANGGILASDTTPILSAINGGTDGCQILAWAASNGDQIITQIIIPPDLDDTKNIELHCRTKSAGTTDAVGFTVETFFDEGDTKVSDATATNQTTGWLEKIATIATADVPASQTLTVGLTPVAHTTDIMYCSAIWLEYTARILTA